MHYQIPSYHTYYILTLATFYSSISESQQKVAIISEMIHTASLIHDDVIDESCERRNEPTINATSGNKTVRYIQSMFILISNNNFRPF